MACSMASSSMLRKALLEPLEEDERAEQSRDVALGLADHGLDEDWQRREP